MTSDSKHALRRVLAHLNRRAILLRETSTLVPDPTLCIGIAPVRLAGEERLQALAFGPLGSDPPHILTFVNPLDPNVPGLERFARFLADYCAHSAADGQLPRIWLAHSSALKVLEVLGERYCSNSYACADLVQLGKLCAALIKETLHAGQQVVAVAGELLREHAVTGMMPSEEMHLGAFVAWVNPAAGSDPLLEANRRALLPANGLPPRPVDDELDALRPDAKKGNAAACSRVVALLEKAALAEWELLLEGRQAFWNLGLAAGPHLAVLATESRSRIEWTTGTLPRPASQPHALARELDNLKLAEAMSEDAHVRGDLLVREQARDAGRAFAARLVGVRTVARQTVLRLHTQQTILRLRQGTTIQTIDGRLQGRVESVRPSSGGGREIVLVLTSAYRPTAGSQSEWTDSGYLDLRSWTNKVYRAMEEAHSPLAYGTALPPRLPRPDLPTENLLTIARRLRRR